MPRLAGFAGRARGRIAADLGLQLDDVDELVGLPAQLIGDSTKSRTAAGNSCSNSRARVRTSRAMSALPSRAQPSVMLSATTRKGCRY
jgi:hypothetical protein